MSTPHIPPWLSKVLNPEYLREALQVLASRESRREAARKASRPERHQRVQPGHMRSQSKKVAGFENSGHYSVKVGADEENARRNRYYELEPYDRTRVVVPVGDKDPSHGQYLNASWVLERLGHKWWIASQAPLPNTAHTFLSMIMHPAMRPSPSLLSPHTPTYPPSQSTRIRTVVQLTSIIEGGRRKAHAYFPSTVGKFIIVPPEDGRSFPALKVTLLHLETIQDAHCVKSTVSIVPVHNPPSRSPQTFDYMDAEEDADGVDRYGEQKDTRVIFTHLLYTSWPDHGVPEAEDRISLLHFVRLADRINRDTSLSSSDVIGGSIALDPDPPIVVGCSAGVGRTGSFIALSSLLRSLHELPPPSFSTPSSVIPPSPLGPLPERFGEDLVALEIDSLREQRQRMVERPEQVILIYEMLLDYFKASS